jgi:tetratricopeptide (TPR) repeat protein
MQAGFKTDQVDVNGRYNDFSRISDEADEREHVFHFCPECGSQVFYTEPDEPDLIVVSVGAFADPNFPPPTRSGYDSSRHPWVGLPGSVLRHLPGAWEPAQLLYDEGRYAEAADRGREAMAAYPDNPGLAYNVACCESLAGRAPEALDYLRQAIEQSNEFRELAKRDSDFDSIRAQPAFVELVGG